MIENIIKKAKKLLEDKEVDIVIGYTEGSDGNVMAHFAFKPEDADKFIYNENCVQNLAVYLVKGEVKKIGKACLIANLPAMRSILQISSENQLKEENIVCLGISDDGQMIEFNGFKDITIQENMLILVLQFIKSRTKEWRKLRYSLKI